MLLNTSILFSILSSFLFDSASGTFAWENVPCNKHIIPDNCDNVMYFMRSVNDYERCAPAFLPLNIRNYFLAYSGEGLTYRWNIDAFKKIKIYPRIFRDVSRNSLEITTLGQKIAHPIGISPTAHHNFVHPLGEIATASAAAHVKAVMILNSFSSYSIEQISGAVKGRPVHLWLDVYIYKNTSITLDLIRRAEKQGIKAIVLTSDLSARPDISCNSENEIVHDNANFPGRTFLNMDIDMNTFDHIRWLKTMTYLPIVVKGIMTGDDAKLAIQSGASAIFVSNHGGRQVDSVPATIDLLPEVVKAVKEVDPDIDVYMDGGVRTGTDVYKAISRGAKMVFVGRPVIWGLTLGGQEGVKNVLEILIKEFKETMLLSGASKPSEIHRNSTS